jgi:CheY-like chemotaxis protein
VTILVVDDTQSLRNSIRRVFEMSGYTVLEAESGEEALGTLQDTAVDLLWTDRRMPGGMSGIQLAAEARAMFPTLPIVLFTALLRDEFLPKSPDVNVVLEKTGNVSHMLAVVEELLGIHALDNPHPAV